MLQNYNFPYSMLYIILYGSQAVEEEAAPIKKEKTHFTVKLTELKAAEKVKLIKEVKNSMQGLNLVQVCLCVYSVVVVTLCMCGSMEGLSHSQVSASTMFGYFDFIQDACNCWLPKDVGERGLSHVGF